MDTTISKLGVSSRVGTPVTLPKVLLTFFIILSSVAAFSFAAQLTMDSDIFPDFSNANSCRQGKFCTSNDQCDLMRDGSGKCDFVGKYIRTCTCNIATNKPKITTTIKPKQTITPANVQVQSEGGSPTLQDFWDGKAMLKDEKRILFGSDYYQATCDFDFAFHNSGLSIVENPVSKKIYYFSDIGASRLVPIVSESSSNDGGLNFTNRKVIVDLIVNQKDCPTTPPASGTSSIAHWNINNKVYCHKQLREPSVVFRNNAYWILYEAEAVTAEGESVNGPALLKLTEADMATLPIKVKHGINFRQHPLMVGVYDGDPINPGIQEISISTPNWVDDDLSNGVNILWSGIFPLNKQPGKQSNLVDYGDVALSTWERVDTYFGSFSNTPGGNASTACNLDPMYCFFSPKYNNVTSPYYAIGTYGWDTKDAELQGLIKEGNYYYGLVLGGASTGPCPTCPAANVGFVRTATLNPPRWEFKPTYPGGGEVLLGKINTPYYGTFPKFSKIQGKWYVYFLQARENPVGCSHPEFITRNYRRALNWIK